MSSGLFATPTPTPFGIPQSDGTGFIDPNWLVRGNFSSPAIFQQTDGTGAVFGTGVALTLSTQVQKSVWAGPISGANAPPTFRLLASADIPDLSGVYQPLNTHLTNFGGLADGTGWLHNDGAGVFTYSIPSGGPPSGSAGGDLTGTYPNPTLTAILTAGGPTGSATVAPVITYDAKGRLTAVSSATITPAFSSLTSKPTTLAGYGITDAQPLNAKLTTIAALADAVGWLHNDGAGVFAYSTPSGAVGANPTASLGLTVINGVATTFMRSDAAPALSQAISPTWSGTHIFQNLVTAPSLVLNTTPLAATSGGSGFASYAVGDLLFASTTTALSKLADVATGNALISGGIGIAPSWGKIGLATHVSGTLPLGNGGTGATSLGNSIVNAGSVLDTVQDIRTSSIPVFASAGLYDTSGTTALTFHAGGTSGSPWNSFQFFARGSALHDFGIYSQRTGNDIMTVLDTDSGDVMTLHGALKTGSPAGGTAQPWKFGSITTAVSALDTARYIQADINGVACKIALIV
jgi:hypothetical protein